MKRGRELLLTLERLASEIQQNIRKHIDAVSLKIEEAKKREDKIGTLLADALERYSKKLEELANQFQALASETKKELNDILIKTEKNDVELAKLVDEHYAFVHDKMNEMKKIRGEFEDWQKRKAVLLIRAYSEYLSKLNDATKELEEMLSGG